MSVVGGVLSHFGVTISRRSCKLTVMRCRGLAFAAGIVVTICDVRRVASTAAATDWTQWGGPTRNFMSDAKGLASAWPSGGPKKRWSRALGGGHSAILTERGRLHT